MPQSLTKRSRLKRHQKIWNEYVRLMAQPDSMAKATEQAVAKKFSVSISTVQNVKRKYAQL